MNIAEAIANRISTMSDDEVAEMWCKWVDCYMCPVYKDCTTTVEPCNKLVLDYLKTHLIK